jgi:hypothetical protein
MNAPRTLLSLALAALCFAPAAAFADGRFGHRATSPQVHVPPPPPVDSRAHGRYELRPVSQWVEGHWMQSWVPEQCVRMGRRGRLKCTPAHHTRQWVPGHYQQVEQWVWVPHPGPRFQVSMRW